MALSQYLEQTAGPAVVQGPGYKTPYAQTVQAMRGTVPVSVQALLNGVAANLPTGATLYCGLKLASAMKGPWLALCQLAAVDLVNSPGLWSGNLGLNNVAMRAAMHADINDSTPEVQNLPCLAELYYTLPAVDGVTPDPVGSINFNFSVGAPLVNDTENIAPDPNTPFPSAAVLTATVAEVTALSAQVAALPAPVNTNAAQLQPWPAYLANIEAFSVVYTGGSTITLALGNAGLTYAYPGLVVQWIAQASAFGQTTINVQLGNLLTNTEDILDAIAAAISGGTIPNSGQVLNINLAFGTNAPASPAVAHQDATLVLQLPAPVPANAGGLFSPAGGYSVIIYDATIPFAASSDNGSVTTVGVQDSPAMADVVTFINSQPSFPGSLVTCFVDDGTGGSTLAPDGSYSGVDPFEGDYSLVYTGSAVISNNPGVVAMSNPSVATIQGFNGSSVTTF